MDSKQAAERKQTDILIGSRGEVERSDAWNALLPMIYKSILAHLNFLIAKNAIPNGFKNRNWNTFAQTETAAIVAHLLANDHKVLKAFRRDSKFTTFLYRIVVNHVNGKLRLAEFRYYRESLDAIDEDDNIRHERLLWEVSQDIESVEASVLKNERKDAVAACLRALPTMQREVLIQTLLEKRSADEVGNALGKSSNAIAKIKSRAWKKLLRCLREKGWLDLS